MREPVDGPARGDCLVEARRYRRCLRFASERHDFKFANRSWNESSNDQLLSRRHANAGGAGAIANMRHFCHPRRRATQNGQRRSAENCQVLAREVTKSGGADRLMAAHLAAGPAHLSHEVRHLARPPKRAKKSRILRVSKRIPRYSNSARSPRRRLARRTVGLGSRLR